MNQEIRKYLIDQCVKGRPIFYEDVAEKLNLNLELAQDRLILSTTLGEISAFEHDKSRPLISSIAIYKTANDHGNGFYNLCEELGLGDSSKLKRDFFGFTQIEESKKYWQDKFHYEQFYELDILNYSDTQNPFFNKEEIDFFNSWANKAYDKTNIDHVSSKNYLLDTVWSKTKFWSNEVIKKLEKYEVSNKRTWSKRGSLEGKTVSVFKPYTWAKIYKKGDRNKNIFFTIGIDTEQNALVYKLDYYYENDSTLSKEQKELCEKHIPKSLRWNEILAEELTDWNWESLINHTVDFIANNSHHYDQLVNLVWGDNNPKEVFKNSISLKDFPSGGFSDLPELNPKFKGRDIDFVRENQENKELGDSGEELVKEYEKDKLRQKGMSAFADKVEIVEDGKGYDVLSFDENGSEIYIEVKTTRGNEKSYFHFSINEKLFSEKYADSYFLYRLYNYDDEKNNADYFIIKNPSEELLFQPTDFKVYLKRK